MSENQEPKAPKASKKKKPTDPEAKIQVLMLRGYDKFNKGEVVVFPESKAMPLLEDVREGGAFAELIQVME